MEQELEKLRSDLEFLTKCWRRLQIRYISLYEDYEVLQKNYKNVLNQYSCLNEQLTEKMSRIHYLEDDFDFLKINKEKLSQIIEENTKRN